MLDADQELARSRCGGPLVKSVFQIISENRCELAALVPVRESDLEDCYKAFRRLHLSRLAVWALPLRLSLK